MGFFSNFAQPINTSGPIVPAEFPGFQGPFPRPSGGGNGATHYPISWPFTPPAWAHPGYVGPVSGDNHLTAARVLTDGRSLHPMQRQGDVPHSGFPSLAAGSPAGQGNAPAAAETHLLSPAVLNPSATHAIFAGGRL